MVPQRGHQTHEATSLAHRVSGASSKEVFSACHIAVVVEFGQVDWFDIIVFLEEIREVDACGNGMIGTESCVNGPLRNLIEDGSTYPHCVIWSVCDTVSPRESEYGVGFQVSTSVSSNTYSAAMCLKNLPTNHNISSVILTSNDIYTHATDLARPSRWPILAADPDALVHQGSSYSPPSIASRCRGQEWSGYRR